MLVVALLLFYSIVAQLCSVQFAACKFCAVVILPAFVHSVYCFDNCCAAVILMVAVLIDVLLLLCQFMYKLFCSCCASLFLLL